MINLQYIDREIASLKNQLQYHRLYDFLNTVEDVKVFMQYHVFAVWDFMSLLKSLQGSLTNVNAPWLPKENIKLTRFINEIVLEEESDINDLGEYKSHFEMYIDAMVQIGADTTKINQFIALIQNGKSVDNALKSVNLPNAVEEFVLFSFSLIKTNQPHVVAAAFTYGRENILPDIFFEILAKSGKQKQYNKFSYYLERHIELDSNDHGPISLDMISNLCQKDISKWLEVAKIAKKALEKRILLWDKITDLIQTQKQKHITV